MSMAIPTLDTKPRRLKAKKPPKPPPIYNAEYIKSHAINVFRIPKELLAVLALHNDVAIQQMSLPTVKQAEPFPVIQVDDEEGVLTCLTCGVYFLSSERECLREHYRLDWHRYNVKRKLSNFNLPPVTEQQFMDMLENLTDSISGSDSDTSESSNENLDTVAILLEREDQCAAALEQVFVNEAAEGKKHKLHGDLPLSWFTAEPLLPKTIHLGIYKHVIAPEALSESQLLKNGKPYFWTMIMISGGHFAAAVFDLRTSTPQESASQKSITVVAHKTFHRYTTRRKQGGAQSMFGKIRSAGAHLRRYNETALKQEVRELLSEWREYLDNSQTIFIHAPGGNRNTLFDYPDSPLERRDTKIHSFPFMTQRPTLSELKRAFVELTTLKVLRMDEAVIQEHESQMAKVEAVQQNVLEQLSKLHEVVPDEDSLLTVNEQEDLLPDADIERMILLAKQGKEKVLAKFIQRNQEQQIKMISAAKKLPPNNKVSDTGRLCSLLHVAAHHGQPTVVEYLLRELDSDPTVANAGGKVPYDLCKDKSTRNAFRRCMADMPDRWDWLRKARVPSPLTKEMEEEQAAKEAQYKQQQLERQRKLEEEKSKQDKRLSKNTNRKKTQTSSAINMSSETTVSLERERRAKAAEARLAKFQSK
ncbi:hypothetical protein K7432_007215 [Basidiobolus ranarum]|uniref:VLRF1 domain-containing protein n=1 Tax=Basidiobolus ranarum TaxID=34480 RepID=A0ABR2WTM7_9FUNG